MSTSLVVLLTAILTAFGTKLVDQIFKEIGDARAKRKGKEREEYRLARKVRQLLVIAEHFRHVGVKHGVDLDEYTVPEGFEDWDEFIDTGYKAD